MPRSAQTPSERKEPNPQRCPSPNQQAPTARSAGWGLRVATQPSDPSAYACSAPSKVAKRQYVYTWTGATRNYGPFPYYYYNPAFAYRIK